MQIQKITHEVEQEVKSLQGDMEQVTSIALGYIIADGVERNVVKGVAMLTYAAEQDNNRALYILASLYSDGMRFYTDKPEINPKIKADKARALKLFELCANNGFAPAQHKAAEAHYHGHGTLRDYSKAAYWYEQAANQGFAASQVELGIMLLDGTTIEANTDAGYKWLEAAADQGNNLAIYELTKNYAH